MRMSNLVLDSKGRPWLLAIRNTALPSSRRSVFLWHYDGSLWKKRDLLPIIQKNVPGRGFAWGLPGTLVFDKNDRLYIAIGTQKDPGKWGDASQEVVLLSSVDYGATFDYLPISQPDPKQPAWLTSIQRPYDHKPIGIPSFMYTVGGPGTGTTPNLKTQVFFVQLGIK